MNQTIRQQKRLRNFRNCKKCATDTLFRSHKRMVKWFWGSIAVCYGVLGFIGYEIFKFYTN